MSKRSKIKDFNYIHIAGWMVSKLNLKGNSLLIYACIFGFCQDGNTRFTGSMQYIADWTNSTKESVRVCLNQLLDRKLIIKYDMPKDGYKYVEYAINFDTLQKSCIPIQKSCTNNIDNNIEL